MRGRVVADDAPGVVWIEIDGGAIATFSEAGLRVERDIEFRGGMADINNRPYARMIRCSRKQSGCAMNFPLLV